MRSGIVRLLCVSIIRPSISPSVLPLFVLTLFFCPLLSLSLPVLSPCSLPSQLLSPSLHPLLPAFHLPPSLSRYLSTVVSLFVSAIVPSLPASLPLSLYFLDPLSVPASVLSSFCLPLPHSPLTAILPEINKPATGISLAHCISLWFVFGFSFDWTIVLISFRFTET